MESAEGGGGERKEKCNNILKISSYKIIFL